MTGKEVFEASKAYWEEYYSSRVRRKITYRTKPWVDGCKCDGAGWYMVDVDPSDYRYNQLQRCTCNGAGKSFIGALSAFADDRFDTFDMNRPLAEFSAGEYTISIDMQKRQLQKTVQKLSTDEVDNKISYYLWGNVGCGKSHLARAWGIRFAEMGYRVEYRNMLNLVGEFHAALKTRTVEDVIQTLTSADMLIIDDIGAENDQSEWIRSNMLRVIDSRTHRKTLYTSNIDPVDLYNTMDERVADRINQSTRLWLPLQSYRQVIRESNKGKK